MTVLCPCVIPNDEAFANKSNTETGFIRGLKLILLKLVTFMLNNVVSNWVTLNFT